MTKTFKGKRIEDQLKALLLKYDDPNPIKLAGPKLAVLKAICSYANRETLLAWPSIPTLSRLAGAADSTVRLHIKELVREGWLEAAGKHRIPCQNGWNQYVNRYRVTLEKAEAQARGSVQEEAIIRSTDVQRSFNVCSTGVEIKVTAERDKSDSRPSTKVTAESRGLTCFTDNQVHVSDTTPISGLNLLQAERAGLAEVDKTESAEELSIMRRCYQLSAIRPIPTCLTFTERQNLHSLLSTYTLSYLHDLLDFIEMDDDPFWRDRFITAQNGTLSVECPANFEPVNQREKLVQKELGKWHGRFISRKRS